jgi:cysteine desulfuration protein SufE
MDAVEQLIGDFELLDDWEDRYRYVIELGRDLQPLDDDQRTQANKVQGCVSQVWLETNVDTSNPIVPVLSFVGDSDAHIVRGLIAILFTIFSGRTAIEIRDTDALAILRRIGLEDHLTPQRSNGLRSMVERIHNEAAAALSQTTDA